MLYLIKLNIVEKKNTEVIIIKKYFVVNESNNKEVVLDSKNLSDAIEEFVNKFGVDKVTLRQEGHNYNEKTDGLTVIIYDLGLTNWYMKEVIGEDKNNGNE